MCLTSSKESTPPGKRTRGAGNALIADEFEQFVTYVRSLKLNCDNTEAENKRLSQIVSGVYDEKSKKEQEEEEEALAKLKPLPENTKLRMDLNQICALAENSTFKVFSSGDGGVTVKFTAVGEDMAIKKCVVRPGVKEKGLVLYGVHAGAIVVFINEDVKTGNLVCRLPCGHKAMKDEDSPIDIWLKDTLKVLNSDQVGVLVGE